MTAQQSLIDQVDNLNAKVAQLRALVRAAAGCALQIVPAPDDLDLHNDLCELLVVASKIAWLDDGGGSGG